MSDPLTLTVGNFREEVIESGGAVLVDFWASWCGPCRMIAPIVADLANEYEGRVAVGKVDVDAEPGVATDFGIQSIPTLLIFKEGEVVDQVVGAVPKKVLTEKLDAVLADQPASQPA